MGATDRFVGRERELSQLVAALDGGTRTILVSGDAGVGKTRLVAEATRRAAAAGSIVLTGDCLPVSGPLPMLPVASALGELARRDDGTLMTSALAASPEFVRGELGRLLPQFGPGDGGESGRWRRERLFAGVAALLASLARLSAVCLVVEDVHWADSETLDLLTFLARSAGGPMTLIVTRRDDETPATAQVANWLAAARASADMAEINLPPLSVTEVGELAAVLTGDRMRPELVAELHARAEGNPFFTEQLVAVMMAGATDGQPQTVPAELPPRLAGLLTSRADRCHGNARELLAAMSVAGRPLREAELCLVTGLDVGEVRRGLRELAAARLLSDTTGVAHRPRHALLAEAVAAALLRGERVALHERIATALTMSGDRGIAAAIAGHWQAAGRGEEELDARCAAAEDAEGMCAYAEAADHWQRAIVLAADPGTAAAAAATSALPRMYLGAIDALSIGGNRRRARELAEAAYRRFADHPEPPTAAMVLLRVARLRDLEAPASARPLMEKALELYEGCPPSSERAAAWFYYGASLFHADGRLEASSTAFRKAARAAEDAGDSALTGRALVCLATNAFLRGEIADGHLLLERGRALTASHAEASLRVAEYASTVLLTLGRLPEAADVGRLGLQAARHAGLHATMPAGFLTATTAEALLELGRTAEAAVLIEPWTEGPPDRDHYSEHQRRAQIDLLRGDIAAATRRQEQISLLSFAGSIENARRAAQDAAELALWAGRPAEALAEVQRAVRRFEVPDLTILCGRLLTAGLRACADLAEQARARGDSRSLHAALADASALQSWLGQMSNAPFTYHAYVAAIPAERASWEAELTRLGGSSDPLLWAAAADAWRHLGHPHRAGYAWWRQAHAQLDAGNPVSHATATLRDAATAASGHAPLLAQVRRLADRARISLPPDGRAADLDAVPAKQSAPYGLTARELAVLRLLAAGRTNAQIGADLYISPSTASVHVSSILRKLGVTGRVQAAATAERAGLLGQP